MFDMVGEHFFPNSVDSSAQQKPTFRKMPDAIDLHQPPTRKVDEPEECCQG
jgi:hypothetical protein